MRVLFPFLVLLAAVVPCGAAGSAAAQGTHGNGAEPLPVPRFRVSARPLSTAPTPVVDGRVDDAAWSLAPRLTGFVQQRPAPGRAASEDTEVRVRMDQRSLYVAMRLHDSAPDSIVAPLARRDTEVYSEWALVYIDSYHDRRSAFLFAVNPAGVQRDAQVRNDEEWSQDYGWNAVWHAETRRDSAGWTAEFRIPLSQLRFTGTGDSSDTWGIQFGRHLARRNERSFWAPILPTRTGFVSQFGELGDVALGGAPRRLEVVPYTLGQITTRHSAGDDPLVRRQEPSAALGADIRWGVTPDFSLTATLNPDFGQVESDPSEVNLTAQETFFAEQRPFFLEGAELFTFNLFPAGWMFGPQQLFYSRRIGRSPQGTSPASAEYVDRPEATDLLAALKLTGKTRSGWAVGLLSAVTDEMRLTAQYSGGARTQTVVEPRTLYSMGRAQKDLAGGRSYVGAVGTAVWRESTVPGLRSAAFVGGGDFRLRLWNNRYQLAGQLLGSSVRGSPAAITATQLNSVHYFQRPDAKHLSLDSARRSLEGYAGELRFGKVGGTWRWSGAGHVVSPGFEANDLGFHGRSDVLQTSAWIGRQWFSGPRGIRSYDLWMNAWGSWTLAGERERVGNNLYFSAEFTNYWQIESAVEQNVAGVSIPALRGGPALYTPQSLGGFVRLTSDVRRETVYQLIANTARDVGEAGRTLHLSPQVTRRLADRAHVLVAPAVTWWRNPQQYVVRARAGDRYVVGDLAQTTASLVARLDYSFSPRLSLQLYAQPFLTAGTYRSFGEVMEPVASDPERRIRRFPATEVAAQDGRVQVDGVAFRQPDFAFNELRTNTVLRWEYAPGSTLFLVWSHGRSANGLAEPFDAARQARELAGAGGDHVFLLKLSHYLGR